jgi:hypothetical protein
VESQGDGLMAEVSEEGLGGEIFFGGGGKCKNDRL